jgi:hypothetical protein
MSTYRMLAGLALVALILAVAFAGTRRPSAITATAISFHQGVLTLEITNAGPAPVALSTADVVLVDSAGQSYRGDGAALAVIAPGEARRVELGIDLPAGRMLMTARFAPNGAPPLIIEVPR